MTENAIREFVCRWIESSKLNKNAAARVLKKILMALDRNRDSS